MIFLFRHGETTAPNAARQFIGQMDWPLSPRGRDQAAQWRKTLPGISVERVVCSPLSRCLETARILSEGYGLEPEVMADLAEIHLGKWEGVAMSVVKNQDPTAFRLRGEHLDTFRPPQGESFADLLSRVWPVFEKLTKTTLTHQIIVAHAGVNRVLLCQLLGMPLANLFRLGQNLGALNLIDHSSIPPRLAGLNLTLDRFQGL